MRSTLLTISTFALGSAVFLAQMDFSRCEDDLVTMQLKADDASRVAANVRIAADQLHSAKSNLDLCKASGTRKKSCREESNAVEAADSKLQSARFKLDSALSDASRAVSDVQISCEMHEAQPAD
jgi:hypothetical protein